jgi:hypothetical protein
VKIAIMQPYFMPYIGYFQLIAAVDKFVIYDDVQFIKGGWINRNRLLSNGKAMNFNVEMSGASANKKINEIELSKNQKWKMKLLKTISQSYSKAPNFKEVYPLFEAIILYTPENGLLADYVTNGILSICNFLDISTKIGLTSSVYENEVLSGQERVLDICRKEECSLYLNPIGGVDLYSTEVFNDNKMDLKFIKTCNISYSQTKHEFVSSLSILDIIMYNSKAEVKEMLDNYTLI